MPRIYTIGYGSMKVEKFLEILAKNKIEVVIDVRRFPTSKHPEFVKEKLAETLRTHNVEYRHIQELGGYRGGYLDYTGTEEFKRGMKKLLEIAKKKSAAIMCVESNPSGCHRRYISAELERLGWEVIHLKKSSARLRLD